MKAKVLLARFFLHNEKFFVQYL